MTIILVLVFGFEGKQGEVSLHFKFHEGITGRTLLRTVNDSINDHFAEIPANFLTLYYGDLVLFKHTANINFQYFFKMARRLEPFGEMDVPCFDVGSTVRVWGATAMVLAEFLAVLEAVYPPRS